MRPWSHMSRTHLAISYGNISEIALKRIFALAEIFLFNTKYSGYNIFMDNFIGINKKKILIRITSLILFISILNLIILKFHWYFSIWWSDMPMHFLGGFWLGLIFIWFLKPKNLTLNAIFKIILGVLIVSLLWEVFEILVNRATIQDPFNTLDTLSDICFDLAGGFISIFYFVKRIMIKENFKI